MNSPSIHITKLDADNHFKARYPGDVVFRNEELVVARCLWDRPQPFDLGPLRLEYGDIFMEHYYRHEWFNIMVIYSLAGILKGWYCNITEPAQIRETEILWRDLALDLLVLPDGRQLLLDEDEFEDLHPSAEWRVQAQQATDRLRQWVHERHLPFTLSSELDIGES